MSQEQQSPECGSCGMKFDSMTAVFQHIKDVHMDEKPVVTAIKKESPDKKKHTLTIGEKRAQDVISLFDKSPSLKVFKNKTPPTASHSQKDHRKSISLPEEDEPLIILSSDDESDTNNTAEVPAALNHNISEKNLKLLKEFVVEMDAKDPAHVCDVARRLNLKLETVKIWLGHIVICSDMVSGCNHHKLPNFFEKSIENHLLDYFECNPFAKAEELKSLSKKFNIADCGKVSKWFELHGDQCIEMYNKVVENRYTAVLLQKPQQNQMVTFLKANQNPNFGNYKRLAKYIYLNILDVISWCKKNNSLDTLGYKESSSKQIKTIKWKFKFKFGCQRQVMVRDFVINHPEPTEDDYQKLGQTLKVPVEVVQEWTARIKLDPAAAKLFKSQQTGVSPVRQSEGISVLPGKKHLTTRDKIALVKIYRTNPSPSLEEKKRLAAQFDVPLRSIVMWFLCSLKKNELFSSKVGNQKMRAPSPKEAAKSEQTSSPAAVVTIAPANDIPSYSLEILNQSYSRNKSPVESDVKALTGVLNVHRDAVILYFNQMRYNDGLDWVHLKQHNDAFRPYILKVLSQFYDRLNCPTMHDIEELSNVLGLHQDAVKLFVNYKRHTEGLNWMAWNVEEDLREKPLKTRPQIVRAERQKKLMQFYKFKKYPSKVDISNLAESTGLKESSVVMWFYRQRRNDDLDQHFKNNAIKKEKESLTKYKAPGRLTGRARRILSEYYAQKKYPTEVDFRRYAAEAQVKIASSKLYFYHRRNKDGLVQLKQTRMTEKELAARTTIKTEPDLPVEIKQEKDESHLSGEQAIPSTVCVASLCGISPSARGMLKRYFKIHRTPSNVEIDLLAKDLKLTTRMISAWFARERGVCDEDGESTVNRTDTFLKGVMVTDRPVPVGLPYPSNENIPVVNTTHPGSIAGGIENIVSKPADTGDASLEQHTKHSSDGSYKKLTNEIRLILNSIYEVKPNATPNDLMVMAESLGLTQREVAGWWNQRKNTDTAPEALDTKVSEEQERLLRLKFSQNSNPSIEELEAISNEIGLQEMMVLKWYHREKTKFSSGHSHLGGQQVLGGNISMLSAAPPSCATAKPMVPIPQHTILVSEGNSLYPPPSPLQKMYTTTSQTLVANNDYASHSAVYYHSVSSESIRTNLDTFSPHVQPGSYRSTAHSAGAILQIDPSRCQVRYLDSDQDGPPPCNDAPQLVPKTEVGKETEILVPLNKVARIAPFEGSVKRNYENESKNNINCHTISVSEYQDPAATMSDNSTIDRSLFPMAGIHDRSLNPGEAGGDSAAIITVSPDFTLDTQLIRMSSEIEKVPRNAREAFNTMPAGVDMHTQGTGDLRQFSLNQREVITIEDSD